MPDQAHASALERENEVRPDPQALTSNPDPSKNSSSGVDYEPHPEKSIPVSEVRQKIVKAICGLYSGSSSEEDIQVYAREAIYDDPWSYCDTRYKIAGQWWGIALAFSSTRTLATEIVESTPRTIIFKLQTEYTPRVIHVSKVVNSLVSLTLGFDPDAEAGAAAKGTERWKEVVKEHKDMWNENDYSHSGLGKILKEMNGDHLTKVTRPPDWL